MAKTRSQKEESVKQLTDKVNQAKVMVFADFQGLSMKQLSDLRAQLREQSAEFTVTKNSLLQRAFPAAQQASVQFQGPTATLFAYDDEISPIKALVKTLKDTALGKVKSGFLGTLPLDEARILQLAALPTKDELKAKTVGVLVTPLQGMIRVLQGNLRNLVYVLDQIKITKGGEQ